MQHNGCDPPPPRHSEGGPAAARRPRRSPGLRSRCSCFNMRQLCECIVSAWSRMQDDRRNWECSSRFLQLAANAAPLCLWRLQLFGQKLKNCWKQIVKDDWENVLY